MTKYMNMLAMNKPKDVETFRHHANTRCLKINQFHYYLDTYMILWLVYIIIYCLKTPNDGHFFISSQSLNKICLMLCQYATLNGVFN